MLEVRLNQPQQPAQLLAPPAQLVHQRGKVRLASFARFEGLVDLLAGNVAHLLLDRPPLGERERHVLSLEAEGHLAGRRARRYALQRQHFQFRARSARR